MRLSRKIACLINLLVIFVFLTGVFPVLANGSQVQETMLPNGLKVLTKEVHAAPVVSFMVWYRVGSRNEELGKTGLSHLLEHMQFKGTKTLKKGEIDKLIRENGGISNAGTSKDFTFYWETLSNDKLELAMRIESDRMVNSLIDPKEFKSEMTVVRSELEGNENEPDSLLLHELFATAFKAHPYQWPTIGWRHDVESITRDDLYKYYKTYYQPDNATVVIVGDFDTEKALSLVRKYFGSIPKGPAPPKVTAMEPEQLGERRSIVRKAGAAERIIMGYHIPAIGNPDIYSLDVLELVLSSGTSSRLYKSLVDGQLATEAWAGSWTSKDPSLFMLGATARDGVKIADVEKALFDEIERVKTGQISDEELQKALNQFEAQFVYTNDSVTAQAQQLGYFETAYSWHFIDQYLANVRKVTKDDVQRVAGKYLIDKNKTTVTFIPEEMKAPKAEQSRTDIRSPLSSMVAAYRPNDSRSLEKSYLQKKKEPNPELGIAEKNSIAKPTRIVLPNGMVVIVLENKSNPTIAVQGSLNAGSMLEPKGKSGLASLTANLLLKGTTKRTAEQIAATGDFVGMSLDTGADVESATFTGYSLSKNFDLMLELLSDSLRNPVFPADEFQKLKSRRLSFIRQELDNPEAQAVRAFYGNVFPIGHPYYRQSIDEDLADTSAVTREDVLNFYKSNYGSESAIIVVVGDVDTKTAIEKITSYFGDWNGANRPPRPAIPVVSLEEGIVKKVIPMPDKSQVDVILGYPGDLKRSAPDFYPAMVMNFVLGGGGALGSRMGDTIRDEMGLAYNVYSTFEPTLGAGPWYAQLGTNPQNTDRAVKTLVEQIALMRDKGAKQSEVNEAIDFITGSFPVRLEKNSSVANTLHAAELYGMGMDYIQNYRKLYRSVTLEQVNAAAKKYLHPDRYAIVIAGPYSQSGNQ